MLLMLGLSATGALATEVLAPPPSSPPSPSSPSSPSSAEAKAEGGVRVRLVDDGGSEWAGVGHASVVLRRGDERVLLASVDGRFVGNGVPAGVWTLRVEARGFLPSTAEVEVFSGEVRPLDVTFLADLSSMETLDVVALTDGQRLQRSAQAVTVVETEDAQQQSADLGEVMARTQGVGVRRSGGLGSDTRFSLNGLTDDQVRFFLDGVPLDLAGYPAGLSSVPVDLVERVEVYRGVVPIRFGADALGGAVNLVGVEEEDGAGGSFAYQGGAFDTHRVGVHGHLADDETGLRARVTGFFDASENDYTVGVEVPDAVGHLSPATVRRFHDGYLAGGGSLEVGVVKRPWAEALLVRGFASGLRREIQHNIVMTVPYGEPVSTVVTGGGTAAYRHTVGNVHLDVLGGYTWTERGFTDLGECVYDWFGTCIRERTEPGEISPPGTDQAVWDQTGVGRVTVAWRPNPHHGLMLAVAPTCFTRTGDDRLHEGALRDPLTSQRDAFQLVGGLEHQLDTWDERLQNLAFIKYYGQMVASEEPLPGGGLQDVNRSTHRAGLGDSFRLELAHWVYVKASYEWATRLPMPGEIFGDAVLVLDNLELTPETSHNVNLGATLRTSHGRLGEVTVDTNGFLREARDLIVLLGNDRAFTYHNVFGARSVGVEGAASWTSPGDWISVEGNATWLDLRNTSSEGTFGAYVGDRIPNRPWLLANATLSLGASAVATPGDRLTLDWYTRYVHKFYRGWESVGLAAFKQEVPAQLSHTVALTYAVDAGGAGGAGGTLGERVARVSGARGARVSEARGARVSGERGARASGERGARVSCSVEVQNLAGAALYDFFGVQRPGRAVFGKFTISR